MDTSEQCPACKGAGFLPEYEADRGYAGGTHRVGESRCGTCSGTGTVSTLGPIVDAFDDWLTANPGTAVEAIRYAIRTAVYATERTAHSSEDHRHIAVCRDLVSRLYAVSARIP